SRIRPAICASPIPQQLERVLIRPPTGRPRPGSPASRINVCPIWTMIGPSTTRREPSADDAGCSGALSGGIHFSTTYRGPKGVHMAEDFEYISHARLEYRDGYRHAYLGEVPEPVVYGVQGALRQYYGAKEGPPIASTLDHIVAAVAG